MSELSTTFIGIAGMIGAGKSTLATSLGRHLDLPVYFEPVQDNEYLADFIETLRDIVLPPKFTC